MANTTYEKGLARPWPAVRLARFVHRLPLHAVVVLISLVWMTPTVGLLVSSFRPANLVSTTG